MKKKLHIVSIILLFVVSGWAGCSVFIFMNQQWMMDISNHSLISCSLHQNSIQTAGLTGFLGLVFALPFYHLHYWQSNTHTAPGWMLPLAAHIIFAPVVVFLVNYMYISVWPSEKDMEKLDIVYILISSGWKEFFGSYFAIIAAPLLFWAQRSKK